MYRDLIYDVGMHDGSDTAYYLHRGFRVIGIEADAATAAICEGRFASEISAQFSLVHSPVASAARANDYAMPRLQQGMARSETGFSSQFAMQRHRSADVAFGSKGDMKALAEHGRFVTNSGDLAALSQHSNRNQKCRTGLSAIEPSLRQKLLDIENLQAETRPSNSPGDRVCARFSGHRDP
jgi:hypothetical protein